MKLAAVFLSVWLLAGQLYAYSTNCEIEQDEAKGFATSDRFESLTISGDVWFAFYDEDGKVIDLKSTHTYKYIYNDTQLVETERAPSEARRCYFDISKAVEEDDDDNSTPQPPPDDELHAFCRLRGDNARGYVRTPEFESVTISGDVRFTFLNNYGDKIREKTVYTYEYLFNEVKRIKTVRAPWNASECKFDVSEALP